MVDYELIVVGAGPSGSTLARRAALLGLDVLLIDKVKYPRYKACAGALSSKVIKQLDFEIDSVIQRKISGFSIIAPSGFRVNFIPEDRSNPGFTIMRDEFDYLLLQKAQEAGAHVKEECMLVGVTEEKDMVIATLKDGSIITSKYLAGADGVNSTVAKELGFYYGWKGDSVGVAIEVEAEVSSETIRNICGEPSGYEADLFFLYFGDIPHGYMWCFPKRSILSFGGWCRQDKVKMLRQKYQQWYSRFKEKYELNNPKIIIDTAARFPVSTAKKIAKGRSILIGDAAGLVDPFTGEGIPHAIHSGIIAAGILNKAIENDDPKILKLYEKQVKKTIVQELKVSLSMAKLFYKNSKNMETLCRIFRDDQYANYLLSASIGGLMSPKDVKKKFTWRLIKTRPLEAISLFF
ncbi:MAG: NAD(P)/FAD-dependent oxidoreductase [Candidatus Hermodarchaeota archaeon]